MIAHSLSEWSLTCLHIKIMIDKIVWLYAVHYICICSQNNDVILLPVHKLVAGTKNEMALIYVVVF